MKYSKIKPFAEDFKDPNNINVIIERSPMSKVSDSAEGLYVLPNITNCVNISDLIYSLVKMPILLYLSGQDVTHNYTPISMFSSFFENDCLYFVYNQLIFTPINTKDTKTQSYTKTTFKAKKSTYQGQPK